MGRKKKEERVRCRPLRRESDGHLWFVTSRTIEERMWLHPILHCGLEPPNRRTRRKLKHLERHADRRLKKVVERANQQRRKYEPKLTFEDAKRIARGLVGGALAWAQQKYDVKVYALVVMSNHIHLVVQTKHKNLARFMGFFKARVAQTVNLLTGRRGPLWGRRYDAQPILDDAAAAGRLTYTLDNPVSANLVERHDEWPGLNLAYGMADADELTFECLSRTAWQRAGRKKDPGEYFFEVTLKLSPLPQCEGMDRALYRESVLGWLKEGRVKRDRPALGIDKVVRTDFEMRPKQPKDKPRPYAFGCKDELACYADMMSRVVARHERASLAFCAEDFSVRFPEGTYRPAIPLPQAA